ncbi:MAG: hypothetical protein RIS92_2868 [Verrucomicrobiota bacterium]
MLSSVTVCQLWSGSVMERSVALSSLSETETDCQSLEAGSGLVTEYSTEGLPGLKAPHALQVTVTAIWLSLSERNSKLRAAWSGPCHFGSLSFRVVAVQSGGWPQLRRYQSCHPRDPSSMERSGLSVAVELADLSFSGLAESMRELRAKVALFPRPAGWAVSWYSFGVSYTTFAKVKMGWLAFMSGQAAPHWLPVLTAPASRQNRVRAWGSME